MAAAPRSALLSASSGVEPPGREADRLGWSSWSACGRDRPAFIRAATASDAAAAPSAADARHVRLFLLYHHLGRGRPWPELIDGHDIHSQQGRDAAGEAWLRSHLRAKCPGSRVLHKPVSRSVGTYAVATIRGSSGSSRDSALDEPTRTPRRCARARACRRFWCRRPYGRPRACVARSYRRVSSRAC